MKCYERVNICIVELELRGFFLVPCTVSLAHGGRTRPRATEAYWGAILMNMGFSENVQILYNNAVEIYVYTKLAFSLNTEPMHVKKEQKTWYCYSGPPSFFCFSMYLHNNKTHTIVNSYNNSSRASIVDCVLSKNKHNRKNLQTFCFTFENVSKFYWHNPQTILTRTF